MLDLLNDKVTAAENNGNELSLSLAPYQSVICVFDKQPYDVSLPAAKKLICTPADIRFDLSYASHTALSEFKPYKTAVSAKELFSVTKPDEMPEFSGKIRYRAVLERDDIPKDCVGIDLGEVGQCCRLWLNKEDKGMRICPPYRYEWDDSLHDGANELIIEVPNTLANAIRDGFSAYLALPASGLLGPINWLSES